MNNLNTNKEWSAVSRWLHWCMAILIMAQFAMGWIADEMQRSPAKVDLMTAHKSLGITVLLLALLRISWRLFHPAPPPPPDSRNRERSLARWTHRLLYVLMVAVPLSGWLAASTSRIPWSFFWAFPWPRIAQPDQELQHLAEILHAWGLWSLVVLLAGHVAAALYHHFVRKDDILARMLRGDRSA